MNNNVFKYQHWTLPSLFLFSMDVYHNFLIQFMQENNSKYGVFPLI